MKNIIIDSNVNPFEARYEFSIACKSINDIAVSILKNRNDFSNHSDIYPLLSLNSLVLYTDIPI